MNQTTSSATSHSRSFKEFYILNAESLLKHVPRGQYTAIVLLLIEAIEIYSLLLSESYLKIEGTAHNNYLRYISLHELPETIQYIITLCFVLLNISIIMTLFALYIRFCIRNYEGKQIPLLSPLLISYNTICLIPSVLFSSKALSQNSNSTTYLITCQFNIGFTLILALIAGLHSGRFYSYLQVDGLAKHGSLWDYLKHQLLAWSIVIIEIYYPIQSVAYPIIGLIFSISNIWDFFALNAYHSLRTCKTFIALNLHLIILAGVNFLQIFLSQQLNTRVLIDQTEVSISFMKFNQIIALLAFGALSYKLGDIIIEKYSSYIVNCVDFELSQMDYYYYNSSNSVERSQRNPEQKTRSILNRSARNFYIDFFTRRLLEGVSQFGNKKSNIHSALFTSIIRYPVKGRKFLLNNSNPQYSNEQEKNNYFAAGNSHLGDVIDQVESSAEASMKAQIKAITNHYESSSIKYSNNNNISSIPTKSRFIPASTAVQQSSLERPTIQQLFYLLEVTQNYPKLAIKLHEFMNDNAKEHSHSETALILFLEREMQRREESQRQYTSNQIVHLDLAIQLQFEEDLHDLVGNLQVALKQKLRFLLRISQDFIQLSELQATGRKLLKKIKEIALDILILKSRSMHCTELAFINEIFVENLWVDPSDIDLIYFQSMNAAAVTDNKNDQSDNENNEENEENQKNLSRTNPIEKKQSSSFSHKPRITYINKLAYYNKLNQNKIFRHRLNSTNNNNNNNSSYQNRFLNHVIDFKQIVQRECTVMISMSQSRLGRIVKVSNNCNQITGFLPSELLDQNLTVFMPNGIALNHNTIIRKGIENGLFRHYNRDSSPLIMKKKDGFGTRVQLEFQIHMMGGVRHSREIGLISKISITESPNEQYLLVNIPTVGYAAAQKKHPPLPYIDVVSRSIFKHLFEQYFANALDVQTVDFMSIIPVIACIASSLQSPKPTTTTTTADSFESSMNFETLAFLPTKQSSQQQYQNSTHSMSRGASRHFQHSQNRFKLSDLIMQHAIIKRSFNASTKDIYRVGVSLIEYSREDDYHLLFVKFNYVSLVRDEAEVHQLVENLFIPHLIRINAIHQSQSKEFTASILSPSPPSIIPRQIAKEEIPTTRFDSIENQKGNLIQLKQLTLQIDPQKLQQLTPSNTNRSNKAITQYSKALSITTEEFTFIPTTTITMENILTLPPISTKRSLMNQADQQQQFFLSSNPEADQHSLLVQKQQHNSRFSECQEENRTQTKKRKQKEIINSKGKHKNINGMIQGIDAQSSSTSHSDRLNGSLIERIFHPSPNSLMLILLTYIRISFLCIIIVVILTYLSVNSTIVEQRLSFDFAWWSEEMTSRIVSILSLTKEKSFLLAQTSLTPSEYASIKDALLISANAIYAQCMGQFEILSYYSTHDLFLVNFLSTKYMDYMVFIDSTHTVSRRITLRDMFLHAAYSVYTLAAKFGTPQIYLLEFDIMQNMQSFQDKNVQIINEQEQLKLDDFDALNASFLRSLVLILSITISIAVVFMPFFYRFGTHNEFVLRLFASIEPDCVKRMYDSTILASFQAANIQLKRSRERIRIKGEAAATAVISSSFQNKQQYIENVQEYDEDNLEVQSRNTTIPMNVLNKKLSNNTHPFTMKKRKNTPTSTLTKVGVNLLVWVLVIIFTINVQPVVNWMFITNRITDAQIEYSFEKHLHSMQLNLLTCEYLMYSYSATFIDPLTSLVPLQLFAAKLPEEIKLLNEGKQLLSYEYYRLESMYAENPSEKGSFIVSVFTGDLCAALDSQFGQRYAQNILKRDNFDLSECESVFGGLLKKGFLSALSAYELGFQTFSDIVSSPSMTLAEQSSEFSQFYQENRIVEMRAMIRMLKISKEAIIECLRESRTLQYDVIYFTQAALFIFSLVFLTVLFPFAVHPFFHSIQRSRMQIINMLSILQVQNIIENSYVSNYFRSQSI